MKNLLKSWQTLDKLISSTTYSNCNKHKGNKLSAVDISPAEKYQTTIVCKTWENDLPVSYKNEAKSPNLTF